MMTIGTGIGSGVIMNGEVMYESTFKQVRWVAIL